MNTLEKFGLIPINFSTLIDVFDNYKYPKDKVSNLEKSGSLIRLKKALFVVSTKIHITKENFKDILKRKISETDIKKVKNDVRPFIKKKEEMDIWSIDYFIKLVDMIQFK